MKVRKLKHRHSLNRHLNAKWASWTHKIIRKILSSGSTYGKLGPNPALYDFEAKREELREEYAGGFDSVAEE